MNLQNYEKLTVNEYAKSVNIQAIYECEAIFNKFFNHINTKFEQSDLCTTLMVIRDDSQQACYENGQFFLCSGLFKNLFEEDSKDKLSIKNHNVNHYSLCWVIAHEFSHYIQNQNLIKSTFPDINNKAFEFDADRVAITLLYASLNSLFFEISKIELKKMILIGLHYAFKNKTIFDGRAYSTSVITHPTSAMRLHYSMATLAYQDCPSITCNESKETINFLMKVLHKLENDYELDSEYKNNYFDFDQYIKIILIMTTKIYYWNMKNFVYYYN